MKCAATWMSETSWDVELSVHVFSWEEFLALWSHRMLHSLMAEAFFSSVNSIASLSFLFRSQPWSPRAFSPLSQEEGELLHLQSVQSGCCCFCCLFNGPGYRNCLQSGGCLCIPADTQLLPVFACLYPMSRCSGRTQWLWFVSYMACVVRLQRLLY